MGFKSGEQGGQVIIQLSLKPVLAGQAVKHLDASEGVGTSQFLRSLKAADLFF